MLLNHKHFTSHMYLATTLQRVKNCKEKKKKTRKIWRKCSEIVNISFEAVKIKRPYLTCK